MHTRFTTRLPLFGISLLASGLILGALVWLPRLAQAATINVPVGGSIQAAISSANPGDTIQVQAGVFTESLVITKSLTLLGGYDGAFSTRVPRTTVISTSTTGMSVSGSGLQVTIDGFTVRNAATGISAVSANSGGFIVNDNEIHNNNTGLTVNGNFGTQVRISHNRIYSNTLGAGALLNSGGAISVLTNTVEANTGSGLSLTATQFPQVTIAGNRIVSNTGSGGLAYAGIQAGLARIENNEFISNTGSSAGGAVVSLVPGSAVIEGNTFSRNSASGGPGGLLVSAPAGGSVTGGNLKLENNSGTSAGGALFSMPQSPLLLTGTTTVVGNSATGGPGGVMISSGGGAAVEIAGLAVLSNTGTTCGGLNYSSAAPPFGGLSLRNAQFISNTATSGQGGGACLSSVGFTGVADLSGSVFERNVALAGPGGGLAAIGTVGGELLDLSSTRFVENQASQAGAVFIQSVSQGTSVTLRDSIVRGNRASGGAPGVFISTMTEGTLEVLNSRFTDNQATSGIAAGFFLGSAINSSVRFEDNQVLRNTGGDFAGCSIQLMIGGSLRLLRNTIEDNVGDNFSGCSVSTLTAFVSAQVEGNRVQRNVARRDYSGFTLGTASMSSLTMANNRVVENTAGLSGTVPIGGSHAGLMILSTSSAPFELRGNQVLSNTAVISPSAGSGGRYAGLYAGAATNLMQVTGNTVSGNQAQESMAGLMLLGSSVSGEVAENTVRSNTAVTSTAGLWFQGGFSFAAFRRNTVQGNTSAQYTGLMISNPAPFATETENNVLAGNSRGGLTLMNTGVRSRNDTIANNQAGIVMTGTVTATAVVSNAIIYNNGAPFLANPLAFPSTFTMTAQYSDIQGGWPGTGNINVNPQFIGGGSYRLQAGSPVIDQASTLYAPLVDRDGIPRPVGPNADMGAYEWFKTGVALAPSQAQTGLPGATVTYTLQVTNTGSFGETFLLDIPVNPLGWAAVASPVSVTLAPSATASVQVVVTIPAGTPGGAVNTMTVRARAAGDGAVVGIASLQTTAANVAGIQLAPNRAATGTPGTGQVYTHTLTNNGNFTDTVTMSGSSSNGFGLSFSPAVVNVSPGASTVVTVTVNIPSAVVAGLVDTATVTATSSSGIGVKSGTVTDVTTVSQHRVVAPIAVKGEYYLGP